MKRILMAIVLFLGANLFANNEYLRKAINDSDFGLVRDIMTTYTFNEKELQSHLNAADRVLLERRDLAAASNKVWQIVVVVLKYWISKVVVGASAVFLFFLPSLNGDIEIGMALAILTVLAGIGYNVNNVINLVKDIIKNNRLYDEATRIREFIEISMYKLNK